MPVPVLETSRLRLRPFEPSDAPEVQRLCSAREVALNTLMIPHPYPDGKAEEWINAHREDATVLNFAITLQADGTLVGAISLILKPEHDKAEIGYWIGVPYWSRGYATEAASAVIDHAFGPVGVQRVYAAHFSRNTASGRVMLKNGMRHEGTLRCDVKKWEEYLDMEMYSILRPEWEARRRNVSTSRIAGSRQ